MTSIQTLLVRFFLLLAMLAGAASAHAATTTYFHNDLLGSPVAATNASGQVIWRESYRPYGERLTNSAASTGNDVWFTSRRQDVETGLVYMGARYYDPVLGRFVSKDPVGFDEGNVHSFNRYAYANNNPYRYKDPDGRAAETVWDLASFAISVSMFRNDPSIGNFLGATLDGVAVAIPFVPGGVGAIRAASKGIDEAAGVLTSNSTRHQALNEAKDANDIPRSASPDRVIKPGTPEGIEAGLDSRNVRQYEYTNNQGERVAIREDKAVTFNSNGQGDQSPHFNAGPAGGKLKQHYYYDR